MLSSMHTPTVFKHCLLNQKHTVILSSRNRVRFKVTDSWQYRVDRRSLQCTFFPLATDRHSESKTPRVFHRPWKYLPLSLFVTLTLAFSPSHSIPHTVTSSLSFSFSFFSPLSVTVLLLFFPCHHLSPSPCCHYLRLCCSHYCLLLSLYGLYSSGLLQQQKEELVMSNTDCLSQILCSCGQAVMRWVYSHQVCVDKEHEIWEANERQYFYARILNPNFLVSIKY